MPHPLRYGSITKEYPQRNSAVPLSDTLLDHRQNIIAAWKPQREMYPLRYGPSLLGGVCALTTLPVLMHYRRYLSLGRNGFLTSIGATVAMPAFMVTVAHYGLVTVPLLSKRISCPVCYDIRAAAIQLFGGVVFPLVACSTLSLSLATTFRTEAVPLPKYYKEAWAFFKKMNQKLANKVLASVVVSVVGALTMTALQTGALEKISTREAELRVKEQEKKPIIVYRE